jgi:hypothetical protein
MEIKMTNNGGLELLYDKMDLILHIAAFGFGAAIFIMIISAAFKIGWHFMPWILGLAVIAYLLV